MRSKPDLCYTMQCPLAVKCGSTFKVDNVTKVCGHDLDLHPEDGHCTFVENEELCECPGFQSKGKGFVLGAGDPRKAKLAITLEAPGSEEISFPIDGVGAPGIIPRDELERRERDYPEMAGTRFVKVGAPVVGKSGSLLNQWLLPKMGIRREEVYVDNVLRCLPPKNKQGQPYPIGEERHQAEVCCRAYDRIQQFEPQLVEITLHPAGILREVTPLPLLIKDGEKAAGAVGGGFKTLLLMGGKAAEVFLGYGDNVTRWRGHYEVLTKGWRGWYDGIVERLKGKLGKGKGKRRVKVSKVTGEDILDTPSTKRPKFRREKKNG